MADAVERHATKGRGRRVIPERASVVCHPESELQKISLDTEQGSTPDPSVFHGGSSASGTQPNTITSTDQNIGTSDVTREVRTGPSQDVTRASSSDDIGGDVVVATRSKKNLGENDAVGAPSCSYHTRSTGLIP